MTITCSWCHSHLGSKPGEGVTHSICSPCLDANYGPDEIARQTVAEMDGGPLQHVALEQFTPRPTAWDAVELWLLRACLGGVGLLVLVHLWRASW